MALQLLLPWLGLGRLGESRGPWPSVGGAEKAGGAGGRRPSRQGRRGAGAGLAGRGRGLEPIGEGAGRALVAARGAAGGGAAGAAEQVGAGRRRIVESSRHEKKERMGKVIRKKKMKWPGWGGCFRPGPGINMEVRPRESLINK